MLLLHVRALRIEMFTAVVNSLCKLPRSSDCVSVCMFVGLLALQKE